VHVLLLLPLLPMMDDRMRRALWLALCALLGVVAVATVVLGHHAIAAIAIALGLVAFGLSAR
jgi:LPS O-antigen subunit length determinant protein (WzzB/FepE family)